MCTRRVVLYSVYGVPALRPPILDNGGVAFGGGAGFSSMLASAVGPVRLLDPGPALFVEKALPSSSSLFPSTSLPVFAVSVAEGEAEVHRAVAEGVLRGTSSSSTVCFAACGCSVFKAVGFPPLLCRRQNLRRQPFLVASGQGFAMENFVHVHEVMEGCLEVLSWNSVLYSWHSLHMDKKEVLVTPRSSWTPSSVFASSCSKKHGSTRVPGYFFIEGRGFCDFECEWWQ